MIELIPAIDIIDGRCVRLAKGDYDRMTVYNEDPVSQAREFEKLGFNRLHVVDLDGAKASHIVNCDTLKRIAEATNLTIDFGGGIKTTDDLERAFNSGAAMVTVGSVAATNPELFCSWLKRFGASRIILGADVKNGHISINGWKEEAQTELLPFLDYYISRGVDQVLITDISRDGMLTGPAIDLYRKVLDTFPWINLIASGGVSCDEDIISLNSEGVPSVVFGKAFYEGRITKKVRDLFNSPGKNTLAKRIIPCLDVKDGQTVKGTHFVNLRQAGDPVALGKAYSDAGADELIYLDITASVEGRRTFTNVVSQVASKINIPFTVGGGIHELDDVDRLLNAGADKVSINTAAIQNPQLINQIAQKYGSQVCVCAIDARNDADGWHCYINGGRTRTELTLFDWAREVADRGAGEILFTSMDHDGVKQGFACDALAKVADAVPIPVIASGGAGKMEHFRDAFTLGKADAALAASVFHFGEIGIPELKKYLRDEGINVRITH